MLTLDDILTLKSCEELLTVAMEYTYYFVDVNCSLIKCRRVLSVVHHTDVGYVFVLL
jgi:hypothetical protein